VRRRTFLGALCSGAIATASTGCARRLPSSGSTADTTVPSTSTATTAAETTTETPVRVSLSGGPFTALERQPTPADVPFRHAVEFGSQPSPDGPAAVRVAVSNPDDRAHTVWVPHNEPPFPARSARADDGGELVLVTKTENADRVDGCWVGVARSTPTYAARTLDPGATIEATYYVVNPQGSGGCYPAGAYRFEATYAADPPGSGEPPESSAQYGWGFSLVSG